MPGYVKSPEEVRRIEDFLAPSRFACDELGINFHTTWEFARWVLPPWFEPIGAKDKNLCAAYVSLTAYQSAYCGTFDGAIVTLSCSYKGMVGYWMLTEIISPELPVIIGRELWGEVKKNGSGRFFRDGDRMYGYGARRGLTIMEVEAEISGPEHGPKQVRTNGFDIKWFPHTSARGLQYPPLLNIWDITYNYASYREGTGTLKWGHSKWDPTDTIPIVAVGAAVACQYEVLWPLGKQIKLEDPDNVLPQYMWGQAYDDPTFFPVAKRYQGLDKLNPDPDQS